MELSQKSFIIDISQGPKYANKSRKPFAGDIFLFYKSYPKRQGWHTISCKSFQIRLPQMNKSFSAKFTCNNLDVITFM